MSEPVFSHTVEPRLQAALGKVVEMVKAGNLNTRDALYHLHKVYPQRNTSGRLLYVPCGRTAMNLMLGTNLPEADLDMVVFSDFADAASLELLRFLERGVYHKSVHTLHFNPTLVKETNALIPLNDVAIEIINPAFMLVHKYTHLWERKSISYNADLEDAQFLLEVLHNGFMSGAIASATIENIINSALTKMPHGTVKPIINRIEKAMIKYAQSINAPYELP